MNDFKIKISCTGKEDLCYNNRKISKKLNLEQFVNNIEYVKTALILYKTNEDNFTTKSLEFLCKCDNKLSENDFQNFIKEMINFGFSANEKSKIYLMDKSNETIYTYYFQSITESNIEKNKRKPNKSIYHTQILYSVKS